MSGAAATDEQISALRLSAISSGDHLLASVCSVALGDMDPPAVHTAALRALGIHLTWPGGAPQVQARRAVEDTLRAGPPVYEYVTDAEWESGLRPGEPRTVRAWSATDALDHLARLRGHRSAWDAQLAGRPLELRTQRDP